MKKTTCLAAHSILLLKTFRFAGCLAGALLLLQLCGCATWTMKTLPDNDGNLGASQLVLDESDKSNDKYDKVPMEYVASQKNRAYLYTLMDQSRRKCDQFELRIASNMQDVNYTGDLASALLSTGATLARPLTTIHSLTAASAFSTSAKSSFGSDVFINLTISNLYSALDTVYYTRLSDLADALNKYPGDDGTINVPGWVTELKQIHADCSFKGAAAAMSKAINNTAPKSAVGTDISFSGTTQPVKQAFSMTIAISNSGTGNATLTADFKVSLDTRLVPVTAGQLDTASTCKTVTLNGQNIILTAKSTIPPKGCNIIVQVNAEKADQIVQTVNSGALATDLGSNAGSSATVTITDGGAAPAVVPAPTPSGTDISMEFEPKSVGVGTDDVLTLSLATTLTAADTTATDFVLTLPKGLTVSTVQAPTGTCLSGANKLNIAPPPINTVALAKEAAIPIGGCTVIIHVQAATDGAYSVTSSPLNLKSGAKGISTAMNTLKVGSGAAPTLAPAPKPGNVPHVKGISEMYSITR